MNQSKVVLRGIRHKVTDQIKKNKDSFPEDDVHQRLKEVSACRRGYHLLVLVEVIYLAFAAHHFRVSFALFASVV